MNRWAIFLDIEGVSKIYPEDSLRLHLPFDAALDALYRIGSKVYPESPNRLFCHQVGGDGLIIVSEFAEGKPEVPISIAVLLMQVLLRKGAVAKGGISEGTFFDVQGCFPSLSAYPQEGERTFRLGRGILTIFPVMGTALINSHHFASIPPCGCRLAIDNSLMESIPDGLVVNDLDSKTSIVDWIHTKTLTMEGIISDAGLHIPNVNKLEALLVDYVRNTGELGSSEWGRNSLHYNGCITLDK